MQLRNAVEMSGMTEHCDFDEQVTVWKGEESQRPDMVVKMPGGGRIIVDAKVAIDAYLDSLQQSDGDRTATLDRHARHVSTHVQKLAEKQYWKQFEHAPEWVVMFMPLESALIAALEREPDLQVRAMQQHVLIATPTLLVALLASIACGWQREKVAANAREISKTGKELHERLAKFTDSFIKIGAALTKSSEAYNSAIGSLEGRVLPSARKLRELHVTTDDEIATPEPVEVIVREVAAAELRQLPGID
jgi:DNA recombination protein RmuC